VISGHSVLAVIPARGGSKGVRRKNIAPLAGRPLLAWTIDAAHRSKYIDRTVLSSEDESIIRAARLHGCEVPFVRPAELAQDDTPGIEPVMHALRELPGYDIVVLLQPTSPLRDAADVDGCLDRLVSREAAAIVSVRDAVEHPFWTYRIDADGALEPYVRQLGTPAARRQDLPRAFVLNGAIYAAWVASLNETRTFLGPSTIAFQMPPERSIDIDTSDDFAAAEAALARRPAS
jgi:N-acylneuraminate cytidylyltransferase